MQTQQQFAPYFASLTISKVAAPEPFYNIAAVSFTGAQFEAQVPI